jgi:tetratricopeptide (TPR) repeat protein
MRVGLIISVVALLAGFEVGGDDRVTASDGVDRLIARLSFEDPVAREEAGRRILAMGRAARPAVLAAMENSWDPQTRYACQDLILKLPWASPEDPPGVAGILAHYGQAQVFHRVAAVRSIAANHPQHAPAVLVRLIREDPSDELRWLIVSLLRKFDRETLPPIEQVDVGTGAETVRAQNLALAGWAWERRDYPRAVERYWRAAELEAVRPSVEHEVGDADFLFDALVGIEIWNRRPDRAVRAMRIQYARRPETVDRGDEESNKLDSVFALHAGLGPLEGFGEDVRVYARLLGRAQMIYAMGRMYQNRLGRPMLADALYRAAYASNVGSAAERSAVAEFLTNQHWNELAEGELLTIAAAESEVNPRSMHFANAHLRLGLVLARRGDDEGAGRHKQTAMQALESVGGKVTRTKGERRFTEDEATEQMWAEIHWHYFKAAKAKGNRGEMDARAAEVLKLLPEDEHVVLDVAAELVERGRTQDAARLFVKPYASLKQAIKDRPDDPERLNNLAWLCARCGQKLEEAEANIEKALRAKPENYAYLDTAAEVKFRLGKVEEAIALEERALGLKPGDEFMKGQLERFRAGRK